MERDDLLKELYAKELHAHGVHMTKVLSADRQDQAKGIGLLMLALREMLRGNDQANRN